jgi:hypothetical protein
MMVTAVEGRLMVVLVEDWRASACPGRGASLPDPASCPLALLREVRIKGRIRDERPIDTT